MRAAYVSSSAPGYQIAMEVTGTAAGRATDVTGTGAFVPAAGGVEKLGQQTIDGLRTTALRTTVDQSKVVDTLPASERQSASSAITSIEKLTGIRYLPIDAWVDSSNHVRRIVLTETGQVEGQRFSEDVRLDFVKFGPEPVPAAPPADAATNINPLLGTH